MNAFVVDASVVVKWFVPEAYSDAARGLLQAADHYLAPDLLFPEVGSAIWKKVRAGELTAAEGRRLMQDVSGVAVETLPTRGLAADACALAIASRQTVYDALYLTLALRLDTQLLTADERLVRAVSGSTVLAAHVRSIGR